MPRDVSAYVIDGVRAPSVTEILRIEGLADFRFVDPEVLAYAAERGSLLHEWLSLVNDGHISRDDEAPEEIAGYVAGYGKFLDATGFKARSWERVVKNAPLRYCGTYDLLGELPSGLTLVDLKTSAQLYHWVPLQTCGYAMALDPRPARAALRLLRDGTYRFERFTDRQNEHDWISACRMAHYKLRHGIARLEDY